jgi:hypothetical protein
MKLRGRLERLERRQASLPDAEGPAEWASRRWLRVLELVCEMLEREKGERCPADDPLRQAIDLLRGYVESGQVGAYTEYHCGCKLTTFGAWARAQPGDPWHGQPCPIGDDEPERLRQCLHLDARSEALTREEATACP